MTTQAHDNGPSPSGERSTLQGWIKASEDLKTASPGNRFDAACHAVKCAKDIFPTNDPRLLNTFKEAAGAAAQARRYTTADEWLGQAIDLRRQEMSCPGDFLELGRMWADRGDCALKLEEYDSAESCFRSALEQVNGISSAGKEILSLRLCLATLLFRRGAVEEGSRELGTCIAGQGKLSAMDSVPLLQTGVQAVGSLLSCRKTAAMRAVLDGLKLMCPEDKKVFSAGSQVSDDGILSMLWCTRDEMERLRALSWSEEKKPSEAVKYLSQHISATLPRLSAGVPQFDVALGSLADLQRMLGLLYRQAGRPLEAEKSARIMLEQVKKLLPPRDGRLVEFYAITAREVSENCKFADAISLVDEAFTLPYVTGGEGHRALVELMTDLLLGKGSLPEAEKSFEALKELMSKAGSQSADLSTMAAVLAFGSGETEKAEEIIDAIISESEDASPGAYSARHLKAAIMLHKSDYGSTISIVDSLQRDAGKLPELFRMNLGSSCDLLRGRAQLAAGDYAAAKESLDSARENLEARHMLFGRQYIELLAFEAEYHGVLGNNEKAEECRREAEASYNEFRLMNDDGPEN